MLPIVVGGLYFCKAIYSFLIYTLPIKQYLPDFLNIPTTHINASLILMAYLLMLFGLYLRRKNANALFVASLVFVNTWLVYFVLSFFCQTNAFPLGFLFFYFPSTFADKALFYLDAGFCLWIMTTPLSNRFSILFLSDSEALLSRTLRLLQVVLLTGASLFILIYFILVFFRMQYPFELEWQEGGMVDHVLRILSGQRIYVAPSVEFVPFIYAPLYYYVSAVTATITGIGFMPLRLVSFFASLGCFLSIFLLVKAETGSKYSGIIASCLFAATYKISETWFDVARADTLFLFFLLSAIYAIRRASSWKSHFIAGLLMSLSFFTKQTALFIAIPLMAFAFYSDRRRGAVFIGTFLFFAVFGTLLLDRIHDGWYTYYLFDLPRNHPLVRKMFLGFWLSDLVTPLPIAFAMSFVCVATRLSKASKSDFVFYLSIAVAMLGGAWISRLHAGGYPNVLFPAYAVISILFGIAVHRGVELVPPAFPNRVKAMKVFIYQLCIIQFVLLMYHPFLYVPTQKDKAAGAEFIKMMSEMDRDPFVPCHGYLPTLAGKDSYAHAMAIYDLTRGDDGTVKQTLLNDIRNAIRDDRFSAIIADSFLPNRRWFMRVLDGFCVTERPVFDDQEVFWTVTGKKARPETIIEICPEEKPTSAN